MMTQILENILILNGKLQFTVEIQELDAPFFTEEKYGRVLMTLRQQILSLPLNGIQQRMEI